MSGGFYNLPHDNKLSISSSYTHVPRHRTVEFGDGYIQRTPLGIHHSRRSISLTYDNLDPATADAVVFAFENSLETGDPFYIASNTMLRTSGYFYLQNFDVSMSSPEIRTITASLTEVYNV
jgi:hypothetical protein